MTPKGAWPRSRVLLLKQWVPQNVGLFLVDCIFSRFDFIVWTVDIQTDRITESHNTDADDHYTHTTDTSNRRWRNCVFSFGRYRYRLLVDE